MKFNRITISLPLFALCSMLFVAPLLADMKCDGPAKVLKETNATASSWANVRGAAGSLRAECASLFDLGSSALKADASGAKAQAFKLESTPHVFLNDYDDKAHCQAKLDETSKRPIVYSGLTFTSVQELSDWFGKFSQGSGKEGKQLYAVCDKSCSPQFVLLVKELDGKLVTEASSVCGHARDKSDDTYDLKLSSIVSCQ